MLLFDQQRVGKNGPMCDPLTRWILLLALVTGIAEFGLRLSTLQPKLRSCPWRQWPGLLWQTVLDDRIHLMGIPARWHPPPSHSGDSSP